MLTPQRPVLRILGSGLSDLRYTHAANLAGREYGVRYEIVGGCLESAAFLDSLDKHNQQVEKQLENEFGKDWSTKLHARADTLDYEISQAESFLERLPDYKKRKLAYESRGIIVDVWTEPTAKKGIYSLQAYEVKLEEDSIRNVLYSWIYDIDKRKILASSCINCSF